MKNNDKETCYIVGSESGKESYLISVALYKAAQNR